MNRSRNTTKRFIKVFVVEFLAKSVRGGMVGLKLLVVWDKTIKIPSFVAKLGPVVEILSRRHTKHVVVDGRASAKNLASSPAMDFSQCTLLSGMSGMSH